MRFRKSIKIAPGLKLNISKSGVTTTVGKRGASINVGRKRGAKATVGIPGSGLAHEIQLTEGKRAGNRGSDLDRGVRRRGTSIWVVLAWLWGVGIVVALLVGQFAG